MKNELAEEEIPIVENEINKKIEYEHFFYSVEQILNNLNNRIKPRIIRVIKAFYGIGCDEKTLKEIVNEYQEHHEYSVWGSKYSRIYSKIIEAKNKGESFLKIHRKKLLKN